MDTVRIDVMTSDDLRAISQRAGLSSPIIVTLNDVAIDMNEAFHETCHTAMLEGSRSFADQAAWCDAVAARAEGLATLILSTTPGDCWAPWDAYELLQHGVPGSDDPAVAADLRQLLTLVATSTSRTTLDGHFLNALATAAPGLRALAMVAKRAELHFSQQIKRGGKAPHRARRHLMSRLFDIYVRLHGVPPTVSVRHETVGNRDHVPGGPSMDWYSGLFALVEPRLPDGPSTNALRVICRDALTKSDALAGWISDAAKQSRSKRDLRD